MVRNQALRPVRIPTRLIRAQPSSVHRLRQHSIPRTVPSLVTWWTSCAHLITWIEDPDHNVDAESQVKVPRAVRTAYSQMTESPETRQDVYARHQVPTIRAFLTSYQLDGEPDLGPLNEMLTLAEEVKNKYCYGADNLDYEQSQVENPTDSHEYPESQDGDLPDFEQVQHQADELYLDVPSQQLSLDDTGISGQKRNRRFGKANWATEFNEEYAV